MKMNRRFWALLLAVMMLTSMLPMNTVVASAADVSVSISDANIVKTGCLEAKVSGAGSAAYQWSRSDTQNGTYTNIDGATGNSFNVAVDGGARKWYKVTVTAGGQTASATKQVSYFDELQNISFETPKYENVKTSDYRYQIATIGTEFLQIPQSYDGLFWKTTAYYRSQKLTTEDYYIEIVKASAKEPNYFHTTTAADGNQFAELNCESYGALYQDILTKPGSTLHWNLSHRGRNGEDTMYVVIIGTDKAANVNTNVSTVDDEYIVAKITDGNTAWNEYGGDYIVPEGQYVTRLYFASVATAGNEQKTGNLLDNISFSVKDPGPSDLYDYTFNYFVNGKRVGIVTGKASKNGKVSDPRQAYYTGLGYTAVAGNVYEMTISDTEVNALDLYYIAPVTVPTVNVEKIWAHGDLDNTDYKAASATINLLKNGGKIDSVTLTEATGWTHSFEIANFDPAATYSVEEVGINNYTAKIEPAAIELGGVSLGDNALTEVPSGNELHHDIGSSTFLAANKGSNYYVWTETALTTAQETKVLELLNALNLSGMGKTLTASNTVFAYGKTPTFTMDGETVKIDHLDEAGQASANYWVHFSKKNLWSLFYHGPLDVTNSVDVTVTNTGANLYDVDYAFDGTAPAGVTAPTDDSSYLEGATVTIDTTFPANKLVEDDDGVNWKFGGWAYYLYGTNDDFRINGASTIDMPAYDIDIYGSWTRDYKVSYSYSNAPADADSLPANARYFETDSVEIADAPPAVRSGHTLYTFDGWKIGANAAEDFAMPDSDVEIVGNWSSEEDDTYTVTYTYNNTPAGAPAEPDDETGLYADDTATDPEISNIAHWTFDGWYIDPELTGDKWVFTDEIGGHLNLYGGWVEDDKYEVEYQYNNAPANVPDLPADASYYEEDSVTVASGNLTSTTTTNDAGQTGSWSFEGWETADATIEDGSFTMPAKKVTITGNWRFTPNSHTVTYQWDENEVPSDAALPKGNPFAVADKGSHTVAAAPTSTAKTNAAGQSGIWTFDGWDETRTEITNITANVIITGRWQFTEAGKYGVTYRYTNIVPGMPALPTDSGEYYAEKTVNVADAPVEDGWYYYSATNTYYYFDGWYLGEDYVDESFKMPVGGAVLTGSWSKEVGQTFGINYEFDDATPAEFDAYLPTAQTGLLAGRTYALRSPSKNLATADDGTLWRFLGWTLSALPQEDMQLMSVAAVDTPEITIDSDGNITMPEFSVLATGSWEKLEGTVYSVDVQHRYYRNGNLNYSEDESNVDVTSATRLRDLFRSRSNYAFRDASISWTLASAVGSSVNETITKLTADIAANQAQIAALLGESDLAALEQQRSDYEHILDSNPALIDEFNSAIEANETAIEELEEQLAVLDSGLAGLIDEDKIAEQNNLIAEKNQKILDAKATKNSNIQERDKLQQELDDANDNYLTLKTLLDTVNQLGEENTVKQEEIKNLEAQNAAGEKTLGRNDTFDFEDGYKYTITINYRRTSSPSPNPDPTPVNPDGDTITIDDALVPLANNPLTGDSTVVGLAAALAACSAIAMAAVSLKKKK